MSVVVLGSANMDLVARLPRPPAVGETVFGSDLVQVPGGKGLNQAVAARRAGADVAFAGAFGRDAHGDALAAVLAAEGIGAGAVRRVGRPTGVALIEVFASGDNAIVVCPGANAAVQDLGDADRGLIAGADFLVMQFELDPAVLLEAARFARGHGVRTVLTPAPVVAHDPELIALTDLLVLNAGEAVQLSGIDDPADAAAALSERAGAVVATLGADGSLLARDGSVAERLPARRVQAVDTTAAGDTYAGVLTARLDAGDDLPEAMRWATAAASIAVTRPGASSSMPGEAEIRAVLEG
ncbi:ribokinase [Glycomyces sp. NPDC047010]|uniref:ribokinase n=1 Tax=Glycomyces sp. NPDC047010 TaxID=3155023 RepID=UPI00340D518B